MQARPQAGFMYADYQDIKTRTDLLLQKDPQNKKLQNFKEQVETAEQLLPNVKNGAFWALKKEVKVSFNNEIKRLLKVLDELEKSFPSQEKTSGPSV